MHKSRHLRCFWASLALILGMVGSGGLPAAAESPARKGADFASGTGNIIYLGAAIGLPLLSGGGDGRNHALRAADAIGTSVLLSYGLKSLVREKRPDANTHDSFPSGHATAAFAAATVESDLHPKQAPLWYLGATLIAYSRVRLHRHYDRDVIAGALIGYGTAGTVGPTWADPRASDLARQPQLRFAGQWHMAVTLRPVFLTAPVAFAAVGGGDG